MVGRHLMVSATLCTVMAMGCTADVSDEAIAYDDENDAIGTAQQAEVITNCPDEAQIPTVAFNRELLITDTSVVDDLSNGGCRTSWETAGCSTTTKNHWHFWYLMQQMAGANNTNVTKFVLRFLESIETWSQPVNGFTLQGRSKIRTLVIDPWMQKTNSNFMNSNCVLGQSINAPANVNCQLDPKASPFRLLAVVNRTDLRSSGSVSSSYGGGSAGEGRMVFGFTNQTGTPITEAALIFEYKLPTRDMFSNPGGWTPLTWAQKWHSVGTAFGPTYSTNLQLITDQFVMAGKNPGGLNNGSAISQVRLNERAFDPNSLNRQWSLREFKLNCYPGDSCTTNNRFLVPVPVAMTPDNSHNLTSRLDDYLNTHKGTILSETDTIPATYTFGATTYNFQGAESRSSPFIGVPGPFMWSNLAELADPSTQDDVRRLFALSTCNGCHYAETQTNNMHILPRAAGVQSAISAYLSASPGDTFGMPSAVIGSNGGEVMFNEPRRRVCEFLNLLAGRSLTLSNTSGRTH